MSAPEDAARGAVPTMDAAESAFVSWLESSEQGRPEPFEALCARQPDLAARLRELRREWTRADELVARLCPRSWTSRVRGLLDTPQERAAEPAGNPALERFVERLQRRGSRGERYRVLEEVGRGGMGTVLSVWDEDLHRSLAMKVIRDRSAEADAALWSRTLGRFLDEAQVMGQLEHPGIVPVHEIGFSGQGRMYFTMQLVRGRDLQAVFQLARKGLEGWSTTRALHALLKVCEAVAYAHSKGVIHRDLKPANVMVGSFGEVYVMDWGLAKVAGEPEAGEARPAGAPHARVWTERRAESADEHDSPLLTVEGDVVGTPAYMPPEQARGDLAQLGTWSDVYALGAMLYHLLAGRMPYVKEEESVRAEVVWRRVLAGPPEPLGALAPEAAPELVAICEKAMAREPRQRYADMQALSDDLRAFLEQRVVRAYASGAWVEAKKWVTRNKPLATALLGVVVALSVGLATTWTQFVRAEDNAHLAQLEATEANAARGAEQVQRELAQQRQADVEEVARFQADVLAKIDPAALGRTVVTRLRDEIEDGMERRGDGREAIDAALASYDGLVASANPTDVGRTAVDEHLLAPASRAVGERFEAQPEVEDFLRGTLSSAFQQIGLLESLEKERLRQLEIAEAAHGADSVEALLAWNNFGVCQQARGRNEEAGSIFRRVVEGMERKGLGDDDRVSMTRMNIGVVLRAMGELEQAEAALRDAHERLRAAGGETSEKALLALDNLARTLWQQGELEEAEAHFRDLLELYRQDGGDDDPRALVTMTTLSSALISAERHGEAETLLLDAVERLRRTRGDAHPDTASALNNLGMLRDGQGRTKEAELLLREAVETRRNALGAAHTQTLFATRNHATLLIQLGRNAEAAGVAERACHDALGALGPENELTCLLAGVWARSLSNQALHVEALGALESVCPGIEGTGELPPGARREILISFRNVFRAWNAAEPGLGHAEQAAAFQELLDLDKAAATK